jgi:hypothetical protein
MSTAQVRAERKAMDEERVRLLAERAALAIHPTGCTLGRTYAPQVGAGRAYIARAALALLALLAHARCAMKQAHPNAQRAFNACKHETACSEDRPRHRIHELEAATTGIASHEAARSDADSLL